MKRLSVEVGTRIELKRYRTEEMAHIYKSSIVEITDTGFWLIHAPIEAGRIIPLETGSDYECVVYTTKTLYKTVFKLVSRLKRGNLHLLKVQLQQGFEKHQRREFFRLYYSFDFKYQHPESTEWFTGTILDISGGGLRFVTGDKMDNRSVLVCRLRLEVNEEIVTLALPAIILEMELVERSPKTYQYRAKFIDTNPDSQELIVKFIFEEQRKRRNIERRN